MPEYRYIDGALHAVATVGSEYTYVDGALLTMEGEAGNVLTVDDVADAVAITEYAQRFAVVGGVEQAELPLLVDTVTITDRAITPLSVEQVETVAVTDGDPVLFALFIAEVSDAVTALDVVRANLGNLTVHGDEFVRVSDFVRTKTPVLALLMYELVAVTEGPMNQNVNGIGTTPPPPPGSTLQDYWVVGIV